MKLDNIIYDVNSLAKAIAEQWNTESEAFKAIYPKKKISIFCLFFK